MLAFAVLGAAALSGGVIDQRVRAGRLDNVHSGLDGDRPRQRGRALGLHVRERIIAAGIENDQAQLLCALRRLEQPVERNGLVLGVPRGREPGIHRDHVVDAIDLDSMAGIEHDDDVGVGRGVLEFANGALEAQIPDIVIRLDHRKARLLELGGHGFGVLDRIGEKRHISVTGIADHQRDALLGIGRIGPDRRADQRQGDRGGEESGPAHRNVPRRHRPATMQRPAKPAKRVDSRPGQADYSGFVMPRQLPQRIITGARGRCDLGHKNAVCCDAAGRGDGGRMRRVNLPAAEGRPPPITLISQTGN